MNYISSSFIQLSVILIVSPLVGGIIKKVKSLTQKRKGPPVLQMYYDLIKLFSKELVISDQSTWILRATPYIVFASTVTASLFVPVMNDLQLPNFAGDGFLVVYTLAMGKFFLTLSALDTGSTFGGMGSSRENMISSLTEPSMLVALFTLGLISGSTSFSKIMDHSSELGLLIINPVYLLISMSLFLILIAETSRIPIDDPSTHLELTMVHEAMILENSGRHLALLEWAAAVKQLLLLTIIINVFFPVNLDGLSNVVASVIVGISVYMLKIIIASIVIAALEISTVKLRLFSTPNLAALSFILSFVAFLQYFVLGGM